MVYLFFDNKTGPGAKTGVYEELAQELHKPAIKKFQTRRVYVKFKNNIWTVYLAQMASLSSMIGGVKEEM